jgi:hypothetical protein
MHGTGRLLSAYSAVGSGIPLVQQDGACAAWAAVHSYVRRHAPHPR